MRSPLIVCDCVLGEPGLCDALLRPRQPRLDHQVLQLVPVQAGQVRDPHQDCGIAVEVRRREEQRLDRRRAGALSRRDRRRGTSARRRAAHLCPDRQRRASGFGGSRRACRARNTRAGRPRRPPWSPLAWRAQARRGRPSSSCRHFARRGAPGASPDAPRGPRTSEARSRPAPGGPVRPACRPPSRSR